MFVRTTQMNTACSLTFSKTKARKWLCKCKQRRHQRTGRDGCFSYEFPFNMPHGTKIFKQGVGTPDTISKPPILDLHTTEHSYNQEPHRTNEPESAQTCYTPQDHHEVDFSLPLLVRFLFAWLRSDAQSTSLQDHGT